VIAYCSLESWTAGSDPLYVFLPRALAGFATAIIFGIQLLLGGFFRHGQGSQQHQSLSKGASQ
jgi:hypothetical protein